jgi:transposase
MDLANEQWRLVEPLIPKPKWRRGRPGRPARDFRDVLNGILWVLRTGAPWKDMPERYPSYQTCQRRFQHWTSAGVFERILRTLAEDLAERGGIDLSEGFIDAFFAAAKRGANRSARPNAARAARSWRLRTATVFLSPSMWPALRPMRCGS